MQTCETTQPDAELKIALDALETCVATPIIAGELATWTEDVNRSWQRASELVRLQIDELHPREFEEIGNQDAELLPRIETLKGEDAGIEDERQALIQVIDRLVRHVPSLEPDEAQASNYTKPVIDEVTAFIVRVRRQAVGVQTWYVEAFSRDRGAVD